MSRLSAACETDRFFLEPSDDLLSFLNGGSSSTAASSSTGSAFSWRRPSTTASPPRFSWNANTTASTTTASTATAAPVSTATTTSQPTPRAPSTTAPQPYVPPTSTTVPTTTTVPSTTTTSTTDTSALTQRLAEEKAKQERMRQSSDPAFRESWADMDDDDEEVTVSSGGIFPTPGENPNGQTWFVRQDPGSSTTTTTVPPATTTAAAAASTTTTTARPWMAQSASIPAGWDQRLQSQGLRSAPASTTTTATTTTANPTSTTTTAAAAAAPTPTPTPTEPRFTTGPQQDLVTQQLDPNSPLCSPVENFEDLHIPPLLLQGLHAMSFSKPSRIQGESLPVILQSQVNLIAQAQSGTGKTCCFSIGSLATVDSTLPHTQVVVICPTLELAAQNFSVICQMGKFLQDISIKEITKGKGGRVSRPLHDHILVCTPGTLLSLYDARKVDFSHVKLLVLDEADAILESDMDQGRGGGGGGGSRGRGSRGRGRRGRGGGLRDQTERVKSLCPSNIRILLFSATYRDTQGFADAQRERQEMALTTFITSFVPNPKKMILVEPERLTLDNMKQYWFYTPSFEKKVQLLDEMYGELTVGQAIFFCGTRVAADQVAHFLKERNHTVEVLHGGMEPAERRRIASLFTLHKCKCLISTNVLSRGFDVRTVTHVVNFDLPSRHPDRAPDFETYLHRIGRTARFGGYGIAMSFCDDETRPWIREIMDHFHCVIEQKTDFDDTEAFQAEGE